MLSFYQIIDTPGIGDTKLADHQVLDIIAEAVYLVRDGVSQIFFVTDGRFDQYEMATYDLLRTIIFDENITNHTTIVRTRFPDFRKSEKCVADLNSMAKEAGEGKTELENIITTKEKELASLSIDDNAKYQELLTEIEKAKKELNNTNLAEIIESCQGRVVYVDNPSIEIKGARESEIKIRKSKRDRSRKILIEHLTKTCQEDAYKPPKLQALSAEIADDYFQYLEKKKELQKELARLKSKETRVVVSQVSPKSNTVAPIVENLAKEESQTEVENNLGIIDPKEMIAQLQDKKEKLQKEIQVKEKLIRQKVLKHIFNNYQEINQELGGDIFLNSVIGDHDWADINQEFTDRELVVRWLSHGFDYQQTKEWATALKNDFDPKIDADFCAWIRDIKQLTVEKIKRLSNPISIEQLREEYALLLVKETYLLDKHNQQLEKKDWTAIHEDFASGYDSDDSDKEETYQQKWEEVGLTIQDAQEWINSEFKPNHYEEVKGWKGQGFTTKEAQEWIQTGLKTNEYELATYCQKKEINLESVKNNLAELREEYQVWLENPPAQEYLNKHYPLSERSKITELYISHKNLTGSLKLEGFSNLTRLSCFANQLTNLNSLNLTKLKLLWIYNNNFPPRDLTVFSDLLNLEELAIGSDNRAKVKQKYNRWTGSLQPLQFLTKLKHLSITNTDLTSGLEYLPESLTGFYCAGTKLAEELAVYGQPNSGVHGDDWGADYTNLLPAWKQVQQAQILQLASFKPPS